MSDRAREREPEEIRALVRMPGEESPAVLRHAIDILEGVSRLLSALSPEEIEATAARVHTGVERRADAPAVYWKLYGARHRVLVDVFTRQHEDLARRASACLAHECADERKDVGREP